jgi:hypothetical protein
MIIGSFSRQTALRRCLTEKAQAGKREVTQPRLTLRLRQRPFGAGQGLEAVEIHRIAQRARMHGYYYLNV